MPAYAFYGASPLLLPLVNAADNYAGRNDIKIFTTEDEAEKF
jgi:hypothetical protein